MLRREVLLLQVTDGLIGAATVAVAATAAFPAATTRRAAAGASTSTGTRAAGCRLGLDHATARGTVTALRMTVSPARRPLSSLYAVRCSGCCNAALHLVHVGVSAWQLSVDTGTAVPRTIDDSASAAGSGRGRHLS